MTNSIFKGEYIINGASIYQSNDNLKRIKIRKVKRGGGYIYKLGYYVRTKNSPFYLCEEYERASKKSITRLFNAINQVFNDIKK